MGAHQAASTKERTARTGVGNKTSLPQTGVENERSPPQAGVGNKTSLPQTGVGNKRSPPETGGLVEVLKKRTSLGSLQVRVFDPVRYLVRWWRNVRVTA